MSKIVGHIPKNITYIAREAHTLGNFWEDIESTQVRMKVNATFVSDSDNPKTIETGESWASRTYGNKKITVTKVDVPNDPITNIQIVDLEIRSQGGRAYKVIIDGKYYVDLREDVLLDTMLETGIKKGGFLNGTFIWGRVGSQMKLIRVGSLLHTELIKSTLLGELPKLKKLEVGGIYRGKLPAIYMYLGAFDTIDVSNVKQHGYGYNPPKFVTKDLKNTMVFLRMNNSKKIVAEFQHFFQYDFKKSHAFVEKVDHYDLSKIDLMGTISTEVVKKVAEIVKSKNQFPHQDQRDRDNRMYSDLACYSKVSLMRPVGDKGLIPIPPEYQLLLSISTKESS